MVHLAEERAYGAWETVLQRGLDEVPWPDLPFTCKLSTYLAIAGLVMRDRNRCGAFGGGLEMRAHWQLAKP